MSVLDKNERTGGLEYKDNTGVGGSDDDDYKGGARPLIVQSLIGPLDEHDIMQPSVDALGQNCLNCDNFVADEASPASSHLVKVNKEMINSKLDDRLESTDSEHVLDGNIEKENNEDSENKGYLEFEEVKRTSKKDVLSRTLPSGNQQLPHQKPGVILLGRGNSFSLGRSEVIVLHHRPKSSRVRMSKKPGNNSNKEDKLMTISEKQNDNVVTLNVIGGSGGRESNNYPTIPTSSPPRISNGLYHPGLQQGELKNPDSDYDNADDGLSSRVIDLVPSYEEDLKDLWHKAESVMALRKDKVRKILEEFGIGEPGGGGGEDEEYWEDDEDVEERKKEEEEVWHIVQENFRV